MATSQDTKDKTCTIPVDKPCSIHCEDTVEAVCSVKEAKLLRKIDLRVLPWLCLTYALSLIDRTNIAAAKISGLEKDLGIARTNGYSVALMVFFIPYIIVELPSNAIIRKFGTRIYLTFLIASWGLIAMCFGFVKNYHQLVTLRVLLGIFEGGFNPACIFVISCWYKRYEVQQRLSIWFVSGSVIAGFTGVFSYALSLMEGQGGLRGWRWIFIVPGAITVALAVPIYYFVANFPEKSSWLTSEERELVRMRLDEDQGDNAATETSTEGFIAAVTDWKVYAMGFLLMLPTAGSYSFAFFTPSILSSFGFSVALSQLLTTPPYIFSAFVSVGSGILADKVQKRSPFIVGFSLLVMVGLALVGWGPNTGARLVGLFFAVTGNNCAIPAALAFLSNNVVQPEKRQFAVPVQTVFGGFGGIIGSLIFRQQDYPGYRPGMYATFECMGLNIAIACVLAFHFQRENKKADKEGLAIGNVPGFRYTI